MGGGLDGVLCGCWLVLSECDFSYQECMLDEDCGKNSYCLYEIVSSKCLPCKDVDMVSLFLGD